MLKRKNRKFKVLSLARQFHLTACWHSCCKTAIMAYRCSTSHQLYAQCALPRGHHGGEALIRSCDKNSTTHRHPMGHASHALCGSWQKLIIQSWVCLFALDTGCRLMTRLFPCMQRLCTPLRVSLLFMHIEQIDCVGFLCGTLLPGMLECCWTFGVM